MPTLCYKGVLLSVCWGDKKATTANKGTISKSSNKRIETIFCPCGVDNSFRSPNTDITIAVEVSTKPEALTNATCHETPNKMPTKVSKMAAATTCMLPKPNICLRKCHKWVGFISKPITNKKITTPNSATCNIVCGSLNQPKP